jgi:hypothetical protein
MKYILLIYQPKNFAANALSAEQYKRVADGYAAVNKTPHITAGPPLGLPADALTVEMRDGQAVARKGPYVEQPGGTVGGFLEFEAENDEEAIRLASKIPAVEYGGAVEIRPSRVYW